MMETEPVAPLLNRRGFLRYALALLSGPAWAQTGDQAGPRLLAPVSCKGKHYLAVSDDPTAAPRLIPTPMRGHALLLDARHPDEVLMIARRPGTLAVRVSLQAGSVIQTWDAGEDRHFFGHACLSADGRYIFVAENNIETGQGVISVRDGRSFAVLQEYPSHGIGPHELLLLPDGHTLAVANGGVSTLPETGRVKLNRGRFDSNLAYVDSRNGRLIDRQPVMMPQLSLRHLALAADGTVAAALQYEGDRQQAGVPLVAIHRPGKSMMLAHAPQAAWDAMHHYAASIAYDAHDRLFVISCPLGNQLAYWSVNGDFVGMMEIPKVSGIAFTKKGGYASNEHGALLALDLSQPAAQAVQQQVGWMWDNHLYPGTADPGA
ncbi:hypothetical protein HNQ59_000603 [Chitinivorax tropicus]|uniref:DUF1513 domain-containing protein n=1 Tax=Chitinivorax tropicus TaxID=714531 RepID=A0A840MJJ0_9PROT|nr:DUF1513 domain-containing protein [Chitinivorax tropicus]MBB5017339.1 hypothetical protein [Chitinivorax tropicus]